MFQWDEENTRRIIQLRDQGYSVKQIAKTMGLTKGAVGGRLSRLGKVKVERHREDSENLSPYQLKLLVWQRSTKGARRTLAMKASACR